MVPFQDSDEPIVRIGDLVVACARNELMPIPLWREEKEIEDSIVLRDLLKDEVMLVIGFDDSDDSAYTHVRVLTTLNEVGIVYSGHTRIVCSSTNIRRNR